MRSQLLGERDVQAVGQEGNEDVCFNPRFFLVVDRPDRKIAFEILERFFDLGELDVVTPQLGGVAAGEIGAQQITAFATPGLPELVAVETVFASLTPNQRSVAMHSLCMYGDCSSFRFNPKRYGEQIMPVIKLTQESISKLRCPEGKRSIQYCDRDLPGLLLEVRSINPSRSTWWIRYRNNASATKYLRLGHYPDMSLDEARQRAKTEKARIQLGADPRAENDAKMAVPTFGDFFEKEYILFAKSRKRTWKKDAEYFRLRIDKELGHIKMDCISSCQAIASDVSSLLTAGFLTNF